MEEGDKWAKEIERKIRDELDRNPLKVNVKDISVYWTFVYPNEIDFDVSLEIEIEFLGYRIDEERRFTGVYNKKTGEIRIIDENLYY